MPIVNRGYGPTHWVARPAAVPVSQASWRKQVWPTAIVPTTVLVFAVFLMQATPPLAAVMALATLVAGGVLATLVSGTAWITRLRLLIAELRH
ncbi:hypothetical protein [Thermomonospora amylolytica]|uniref:hypothetical protein n=1 Tax=Thermomonospora amylolytica TaxID=1411117 RepID=UPI0013006925|nr:hypothetical protein [Thermomonospora amylolytica]